MLVERGSSKGGCSLFVERPLRNPCNHFDDELDLIGSLEKGKKKKEKKKTVFSKCKTPPEVRALFPSAF
jgi:hypothetical protein